MVLLVLLHFYLFNLLNTQWNFGCLGFTKISPYSNGLLYEQCVTCFCFLNFSLLRYHSIVFCLYCFQKQICHFYLWASACRLSPTPPLCQRYLRYSPYSNFDSDMTWWLNWRFVMFLESLVLMFSLNLESLRPLHLHIFFLSLFLLQGLQLHAYHTPWMHLCKILSIWNTFIVTNLMSLTAYSDICVSSGSVLIKFFSSLCFMNSISSSLNAW